MRLKSRPFDKLNKQLVNSEIKINDRIITKVPRHKSETGNNENNENSPSSSYHFQCTLAFSDIFPK